MAAFMQEYASASASNVNGTAQYQSNPTQVTGGGGPIDVSNSQSNATGQSAVADAGDFGGFGYGGLFGGGGDAGASNFNLTVQSQFNPTLVIGDTGPINISNSQSNLTTQHAAADASDFGGFGIAI